MMKNKRTDLAEIQPSSLDLSVVLCVRNEFNSIERVLRDWIEFLSEEGESFELIVINNGSKDGTGRVLDEARKRWRELRVIHQLPSSLSVALRRGYELARGKYCLHIDGSGRAEPRDFSKFLSSRGNAPMVIAFRSHRLDSILKRTYSKVYRKAIRLLYGVRFQDPDMPFVLFERGALLKVFKRISVSYHSLHLMAALLMKKEDDLSVLELPIPYRKSIHFRKTSRACMLSGGFLDDWAEIFRFRWSFSEG